jgi:hypothetical protein
MNERGKCSGNFDESVREKEKSVGKIWEIESVRIFQQFSSKLECSPHRVAAFASIWNSGIPPKKQRKRRKPLPARAKRRIESLIIPK